MAENPLTLSELNSAVHDVLSDNFGDMSFWVCTEISSMQVQRNGHCYLELIEKEPNGNNVVARAKATVWAARYKFLSAAFREVAGTDLQVGMQVLLAVTVQFHEVYGYSLDVSDIDPTYTIGEQARKKQLLLQRLSDEGWVERGHSKPLPLFVRRIALIS
ncbi:MAG: exodeoxyribonuclease VII large subunit, partial [Paludibacteraceae bacterium]|nr:exodeoxyribonuclease VII large subunit [Paludibacteraceae bacterium]